MSREFLFDVLEKFAQVTSIIVETSKIKEDLDRNNSNEKLESILERTKNQVENLLDHATSVKELFDKHGRVNDVNGNEDINTNTSEENNSLGNDINTVCKTEDGNGSQTNKPLIKLVDIKKLVEPRTLLKEHIKQPENALLSETVVISSDEEVPKNKTKPLSSTNSKLSTNSKAAANLQPVPNSQSSSNPTRSRRKAAEETIKRTRISLQVASSTESELSDEEVLIKKASKLKTYDTRKRKELEKITQSDGYRMRKRKGLEDITLSDGSDNSVGSLTLTNNKHKEKPPEEAKSADQTEKPAENNAQEDQTTSDCESNDEWKSDPKFKLKCCVDVIRIPCEKLKEYYLEKLELLEINK